MQALQVKELMAGSDFITFQIESTIELSQQLKVIVWQQKFDFSAPQPQDQLKHIKICEILFEKNVKTQKLPTKIKIEDLPSGTLYKFNFSVISSGNEIVETNVFSTTKSQGYQSESENKSVSNQQNIESQVKNKLIEPSGNILGLCESENILSKYVKIQNIGLDTFSSTDDITKNLLDARLAGGTINYINSNYKTARPAELYQLRKKRAFLIGYQSQMLDDIFGDMKNDTEGKQFGNNDWFMGPFYSYDHNIQFN